MKVGKCPICGGETREAIVEFQETIQGRAYIIKGVEVEVCTQCGERLYSLEQMRRIEEMRKKLVGKRVKPIEVRKVEVVSL